MLQEEDSCNQVEVVRALHTAIINMDNKLAKQNKNGRENAGKPWSEDEESQLLEEYHSGVKVKEIVKAHERSNGAIISKLAKLIAE